MLDETMVLAPGGNSHARRISLDGKDIGCPVAEAGALASLVGEPIDRVQPLFDMIGPRTWRFGELPEQSATVSILGNDLIALVIRS
ncbi:hypothetical protein [Nocardia sp. NPDC049149]|uniref:hypothetical protein n=1 Tax=Nocardia sp. NPDC049149 TaxID=3364315 RepID=UPI0037111E5E